MLLSEIVHIIESVAPLSGQEDWDNSGLQVGEPSADIHAVLLTTDVTESVVSEAISLGCNLIVSHHPLLFRGLKHVCGLTAQERCVMMAIKHGVAIYSSHTAMDVVIEGVSGMIAECLGLQNCRILAPTGSMAKADSDGTSIAQTIGLGVVGELAEPMPYADFLAHVKKQLNASYVHYTDLCEARSARYGAQHAHSVQRIALCGGAGAEFIETAIAKEADVYLSADMKFHEMQSGEGRIALVNVDHWVSEHFTPHVFARILSPYVQCMISKNDASPVHVL